MRYQQTSIIALLLLIFSSVAALAQAQQQLPNSIGGGQFDPGPVAGPPTVTVTEVKLVGFNATILVARVKWNAQIPNTTKVEKFRVFLQVTYNDGTTESPSKEAAASAREATLNITNRGPNNPAKTFKAFIETAFTTIVTQTQDFSGTFSLSKINAFVDNGNNQSTPHPAGGGVTKVGVVSLSEMGKFNVFWVFNQNPPRPDLNEVRFTVTGNFVYLITGTPSTTINRSATLTAGPGARQTQFVFSATPKLQPGQSVNRIDATINLKAIFSITQRKESVPLEGAF